MTPRPPSDVDTLHDYCLAYLGLCEEALATTSGGTPGRAFVSPGPPAWDCCPQLSVHAGGPIIADTMPLTPFLQPAWRVETGVVEMTAMTATVIRCAPQIQNNTPPLAAELTAVAAEVNQDVWAIWNRIRTAATNHEQPWDKELLIDPALALPQGGGCAGWQLTVRIFIPGYAVGT